MSLDLRLEEPIIRYLQLPTTIDGNGSVEDACKEMCKNESGSIIVMREGMPVGMLTEWDVLCKVVAKGKSGSKTMVKEVMSSPIVSIPSTEKVSGALRLMINRGLRRLVVMEGDKMLGMVSQSQIVGNRKKAYTILPVLEPSKGSRCPYCNSVFESIELLSKHIDKVHIGSELLQEGRHNW